MGNLVVDYNQEKKFLLIAFSGSPTYKILLQSLTPFCERQFGEDMKIVLDFSGVESFSVTYSQWTNFKSSFNFVTSSIPENRIAIIGPLTELWEGIFECGGSLEMHEPRKETIQYFHNSQKQAALKWMKVSCAS